MSIWRDLHEHSLGKPRKEEKDTYARMFENILKIDRIPDLSVRLARSPRTAILTIDVR
jgi:hypothetical protein